MSKILIIEDDLAINDLIKTTLEKNDYHCTQAFSGTEGLLNIKTATYDLIILDLMLPGLTGEEFIEKLLEIADIPVLVASGKDSIDSRIACLNLGADDYLIKPFDINELKARVDALIRRTRKNPVSDRLGYKEFILHSELFDLEINGQLLHLTKQEYKIIKLLMENPGKVFIKQEIYEYAWEDYYMGEDKTINVHISNIRRKVKPFTDHELIETVWGIGFKLKK